MSLLLLSQTPNATLGRANFVFVVPPLNNYIITGNSVEAPKWL